MPILHLPPVPDPRAFDEVVDFLSDEAFRVNHRVNAEAFEELAVFGREVVSIVNACHGLFCPHFVGEYAAHHVDALFGRYADEEVSVSDVHFLQHFDGRGFAQLGDDVEEIAHECQSFLVVVDERDVVFFFGKEACEVDAHGACPCNDDFHRDG